MIFKILPNDNGGLLNIRMPPQYRLDFTWLDPEPAHFDLIVDSTQEFDHIVGAKSGTIACSVQPTA